MLINLAVGETYEINGVPVTVRPPTKSHIELYVKLPPGTNIERESKTEFKLTKSS